LRGAPNLKLAAMAKVFASDACVRVVNDALEYLNRIEFDLALVFEHLMIKAHGRFNARAINNAIKVAAEGVRGVVTR
jgi:fatty acid/phospholipid biosynthesis enzyme